MSNLFLFFLLILIPSCTNLPSTPDDDQCTPIMKVVKDDLGVDWISTTESYCLCRKHRFNLDYIGIVPATESWKEPIMNCHKVIGWKPDAYARKASFWENVRSSVKAEIENND